MPSAVASAETRAVADAMATGHFGPSARGLEQSRARAGTLQCRGNVGVAQNPSPCPPYEKLGCEGQYLSHNQSLNELSARQVSVAVDQARAHGSHHRFVG